MPWSYFVIGILFCLAGLYNFYKNVFEEGKSILIPVFIIVMGIVLITIGTGKMNGFFK